LKFSFYIAKRYLVSKKSVNVINLISYIAMGGVAVGTLALVIVLSVFNGLNQLISLQISAFDPDLKITATEGKSFLLSEGKFDQVKALEGIASFSEIIEENALLRYNNRQTVATVKGVPNDYDQLIGLDTTYITEGKFILNRSPYQFAVVGQGVAVNLTLGINYTYPIQFYAPRKGKQSRLNLSNALNQANLFPSGVFAVHQEIDSKFVLVPFSFAKELFESGERISSVEVQLKQDADASSVQKQIKKLLGSRFQVKGKMEQHETIFKVMQSEKWFIFAILSFILIIASFNILGTLMMLIIDKKHDIAILQSMGADNRLIRRIFLFEGWMISIIGAIAGIIIGVLIAWLQIKFEFLKLPGADGTYIMSAYPIQIQWTDLLAIFAVVASIGFILSWYPVRYISGKYIDFSNK